MARAVLPKPNPEHLIVVPEEKDAVAGIERGGGAVFRTAGHATEVFFTGPNFDDAEMELVGKLPMIAQFTARMVAFTDRGMAALSKLHKLESIEIQSDKITNAGIDCLARFAERQEAHPQLPKAYGRRPEGPVGHGAFGGTESYLQPRAWSRSETPGRTLESEVVVVVLPGNLRRTWPPWSPGQSGNP